MLDRPSGPIWALFLAYYYNSRFKTTVNAGPRSELWSHAKHLSQVRVDVTDRDGGLR
jgi:hypothetical protein